MKRRTYAKAALALCLGSLTLLVLGCSGEDDGTERGGGEVEVGGGRGTADGPRGYVRIEMAYLSSAGDADIINARVRFGGEAVWPDCFLIEGPTVEAMERSEEDGGRPFRGRVDSTWTNPDSTEKVLLEDDTLLQSFHKAPGTEAPDPDRSPYFVYCTGGEALSGHDRAHVEGTPES
jgi:hypothetical protein